MLLDTLLLVRDHLPPQPSSGGGLPPPPHPPPIPLLIPAMSRGGRLAKLQ